MGISFTKDERKAIWKQSRLLLKGLLIALAVMVAFGMISLPAVIAGFWWVLVLVALWIGAHHVIEYIEANS